MVKAAKTTSSEAASQPTARALRGEAIATKSTMRAEYLKNQNYTHLLAMESSTQQIKKFQQGLILNMPNLIWEPVTKKHTLMETKTQFPQKK